MRRVTNTRNEFTCKACAHRGSPIEGIEEMEEPERLSGRLFVGCDNCGAPHWLIEVAAQFEVGELIPDEYFA